MPRTPDREKPPTALGRPSKPGPARGGCLCGLIRYRTMAPPRWVAACHCADCRRASGAFLAVYAGYIPTDLIYEAETPREFSSSPGVVRSFCPRCGSSLTYRSTRWPDEIHLLTATLDNPASFCPESHVFDRERPEWLQLADGLPHFPTTPGKD